MGRGAKQRALVVAAALVAVGLVGPSLVRPSVSLPSALTNEGSSSHNMTEFHWDAPPNMTGTFAMLLRLEVENPTTCTVSAEATGQKQDGNPIAFWVRIVAAGESGRAIIQITQAWSRPFQVHAGSVVDSRHVTPAGGSWGQGGLGSALVEQSMEITLAAFDVGVTESAGEDSPLLVRVTCDDPFTIATLMASQHGRSFSQETLTGGLGTTINVGPLAPESFSKGDRLATSFNTSHVRFQATFPNRGDFEGTLALHHPNGTDDWSLRPGVPRSDTLINFDGITGDYEVGLDWFGSDYPYEPEGILIGLDPVRTLDDGL